MARSRRPRPDDCEHERLTRDGYCADCGEDTYDWRRETR